MPRRPVTVLLGLVVLSAPGGSRAETPLSLSWRAPAGCPAADEVRRQVDALLAGPAAAAHRERLAARVTVGRSDRGGRWRVRIETDVAGTQGERTLEGESCSAVAAASALILAMTIDPRAVRGTAGPDESPQPAAAPVRPPVAPAPPAIAATPPPPSAATNGRFFVRPGVVGALGTLPRAAPGLALAAGHRKGQFGMEAFAVALGEVFAASGAGAAAGGTFGLAAGGALGCWIIPPSGRFAACGGGELQRVHGRGRGVSHPGAGAGTWAAALLGGIVRIPLSSTLTVEGALQGAVPFRRPRFVLVGVGDVWRPPLLGGRATAGLALSF